MAEGTIKRIVAERGYGFLARPDGEPDLFFHASDTGGAFEALLVGDTVHFHKGQDPRTGRPTAINVELVRPAAIAVWDALGQ